MQPVDSRAQVSAERAATWSEGCHRPTGGVCQSADAKEGREATDEAAPGGGRGSIPVPVAITPLQAGLRKGRDRPPADWRGPCPAGP
jgi:hypothetical protein